MDFCFVHAADLHLGGRRWLRSTRLLIRGAERDHPRATRRFSVGDLRLTRLPSQLI